MFRNPRIRRIVQQVQQQQLDPVTLVEACLERIHRYEGTVRAWVLVDETGARQAAERIRQDIRQGNAVGPLAGIPIGVKDVFDVRGLPTKAGSRLREDHVAETDAPMVAALRRAGAIVLGKTVTVEFACFDPPPTKNPWTLDMSHTPGGSSSGSAVAVALGMCLGATGTQTGGSLVRPASYCGVAACKPTFGRIGLEGVVPVSYHLDHAGMIAPTVDDLATLLGPVLWPENEPGTACRIPPWDPVGEPDQAVRPRLGLVDEFLGEADESVRLVVLAALERLRAAGASIEPARLEFDFAEIRRMHRRIMAVEAAAYHRPTFPARREAYGPNIASLLDEGLRVPGVDYAEALAHQRMVRRTIGERFGPFDALVMPATNTTAPGLETTGDSGFQSPWSYAGVPAISLP
ncbi:MAG: amidase [Thermoguttaceae bacterium]|nr:amidase [Thermoguttaceae bacterium]